MIKIMRSRSRLTDQDKELLYSILKLFQETSQDVATFSQLATDEATRLNRSFDNIHAEIDILKRSLNTLTIEDHKNDALHTQQLINLEANLKQSLEGLNRQIELSDRAVNQVIQATQSLEQRLESLEDSIDPVTLIRNFSKRDIFIFLILVLTIAFIILLIFGVG